MEEEFADVVTLDALFEFGHDVSGRALAQALAVNPADVAEGAIGRAAAVGVDHAHAASRLGAAVKIVVEQVARGARQQVKVLEKRACGSRHNIPGPWIAERDAVDLSWPRTRGQIHERQLRLADEYRV